MVHREAPVLETMSRCENPSRLIPRIIAHAGVGYSLSSFGIQGLDKIISFIFNLGAIKYSGWLINKFIKAGVKNTSRHDARLGGRRVMAATLTSYKASMVDYQVDTKVANSIL